jgi:hypothetical protein
LSDAALLSDPSATRLKSMFATFCHHAGPCVFFSASFSNLSLFSEYLPNKQSPFLRLVTAPGAIVNL